MQTLKNVLQRSVRWNGTGKPIGRMTIIIFSNASIVGMGLSAGMPAGGVLAGRAPYAGGAPLPAREEGEKGAKRRKTSSVFLLLDFLFSLMGRVLSDHSL